MGRAGRRGEVFVAPKRCLLFSLFSCERYMTIKRGMVYWLYSSCGPLPPYIQFLVPPLLSTFVTGGSAERSIRAQVNK